MAIKTAMWDPTEYSNSPARIAAYLSAAFQDGDIARAVGMTQLAVQAGVTREVLCKTLSHAGDSRLATLLGVVRALGLKLPPRAA